MLKAKAIERFLSQVLDEEHGINGVMLFNKEGMALALARCGRTFSNGNVYAALLSSVWETYEQHTAVRTNPMKEMVLACEHGTVIVTQLSPTMMLAIINDENQTTGSSGSVKEGENESAAEKTTRVSLAELKSRLAALAEHLKGPLSALS